MTFRPELMDERLKEERTPEALLGEGGIFKQLTQALIERPLHCLCGRANGLSRSDGNRFSSNPGATVYRSQGAKRPQRRLRPRPSGGRL